MNDEIEFNLSTLVSLSKYEIQSKKEISKRRLESK